MTTTETAAEKRTPPYISVARLNKMFDILSIKTPDTISNVLFISNGFSTVDALLAISSLKFLGLIDDDKKPTAAMSALRIKGEGRATEIKKIIEQAYKPLFENVEAPYSQTKEDLFNAFSANYPKLSDRVYNAAIPVFLRLAEYAGLKDEGSVRGGWTVNRAKARGKMTTGKDDKTLETRVPRYPAVLSPDSHVHNTIKGKVGVFIPEDWNNETLLNDELLKLWSTALKAVDAYAKKYEELHNDFSRDAAP